MEGGWGPEDVVPVIDARRTPPDESDNPTEPEPTSLMVWITARPTKRRQQQPPHQSSRPDAPRDAGSILGALDKRHGTHARRKMQR